MASIAYLGNFNNYFNRQVKYQPSFETLAGYQSYTNNEKLVRQTSINFNPNDGITTELIVNWNPALDWTPDYVLVLDDSVIYSQGADPVVSRWFVTEFQRTRNGQYRMDLKRDSVADNYYNVISAPAYIEKATLSENNPLIFNSENMSFNQIKKEEILLKDETKMPWIVGYVSKDNNRYPSGSETYQTQLDVGTVILKSEIPSSIRNLIDAGHAYFLDEPSSSDRMDYEFIIRSQFLSIYGYPVYTTLKFHYNYNEYTKVINSDTVYDYAHNLVEMFNGWNVDLNSDFVEATTNDFFMAESGWDSFAVAPVFGSLNSETISMASNILVEAQARVYANRSPIKGALANYLGYTNPTGNTYTDLLAYNGTIFYDSTNQKYYKIKISVLNKKSIVNIPGSSTNAQLQNVRNFMVNAYNNAASDGGINPYLNTDATDDDFIIRFTVPYKDININVEEIPGGSGATVSTFISGARRHLVDAPYDMFCIPYGEFRCSTFTCDKEISLAAAQSLAQAGENVYDIQILPYCPLKSIIISDSVYELAMTEGVDYNYIKTTEGGVVSNKGIIFWCRDSSFTFNIFPPLDQQLKVNRPTTDELVIQHKVYNYTSNSYWYVTVPANGTLDVTRKYIFLTDTYNKRITSYEDVTTVVSGGGNNSLIRYAPQYNTYTGDINFHYRNPTNTALIVAPAINIYYDQATYPTNYKNPLNIDTKISNQCDLYRLNSPNFASAFEFSVAKNGGVEYFNVDCTYKPFTPYIHINPNFKNLYGQDFNDARGLICNGDFSIARATDAWEQYQLQNKNYQLIFNREIENMDTLRDLARNKEVFNLLLSSGAGAGAGAAAGAAAGPVGAAAGGIIGGVSAGITAGFNMGINELTYKENRDFKTDMFNYSLGNVQALPNTLTNVGVLNENNKLFPFIEYYTCTDKEKEAFANKLKWNGMNVMMIGSIGDFIRPEETFMKGQFIRLEGLNDDSHIANDIYNEFNNGLFIGGTSGS